VKAILQKIPDILIAKKSFSLLPYAKYSAIIKKNVGQKISFRCSHILSLTGAINETIGFSPDHSYAKCRSTPEMRVKMNPAMFHDLNFFKKITRLIIYEKHKIFMLNKLTYTICCVTMKNVKFCKLV